MKAYKLIVLTPEDSESVQKKAFELGYKWKVNGFKIQYIDCNFLYMDKDGYIAFDTTDDIFAKDENQLVSIHDFLELTKGGK